MTAVDKVLVICGHPRTDSFCHALADAYEAGARAGGAEVRRLDVARLDFDVHVRYPSPNQQICEPDVARARELIAWAGHVVFVYPTWWGTMPALLKGFLDRVLVPGFAFEETEDPAVWKRLLEGRSAELVVTMDTPPWVYRLVYKQPGHNAMRRATLGFCGIEPTLVQTIGPVKPADEQQRAAWLTQVREAGERLSRRLARARRRRHAASWVKALRLQFYPMTWIAYTIGALAAVQGGGAFSGARYWLGYAALFLVEAMTVFINEYVDYDSDRRNDNAGPFNGGSRVLVTGELKRGHLPWAVGLLALPLAGVVWWLFAPPSPLDGTDFALLALAGLLAVGYTLPPLKLSYRGLGELDVALTHSVVVILAGYVVQTGHWGDPFPWLVGVPLFFATLPSIILSGIPDHDADRAVGKRTLAVIAGPARAAQWALVSALAAVILGWVWYGGGMFQGGLWFVALALATLHALWLVYALAGYLRRGGPVERINGLMVLSLTFVLWFGVVPLLDLWWRLPG